MPDISLGIPVFNSSAFLDELFACLRQLQPPPAEIVLLDDASTDDSLARLREFSADSRISVPVRVLRNERNLGIAGTYNRLAREVHAEWIQILDADDLLASRDFYARVGDALKADTDLLVTGLASNSRFLGACARVFGYVVPRRPPTWLPLLGSVATRAGVLYRRQMLIEHPFAEPSYAGSDVIHLLAWRNMKRCVFLRSPRVFYRVHREAQSSRRDRDYSRYRQCLSGYGAAIRILYGIDLRLRQIGQRCVR